MKYLVVDGSRLNSIFNIPSTNTSSRSFSFRPNFIIEDPLHKEKIKNLDFLEMA